MTLSALFSPEQFTDSAAGFSSAVGEITFVCVCGGRRP